MAITIKVEGGTPNASVPSLCHRCRHGASLVDDKGQTFVRCDMGMNPPYKVVKCNRFDHSSAPRVFGFDAWIYRTVHTRQGSITRFVSPNEHAIDECYPSNGLSPESTSE